MLRIRTLGASEITIDGRRVSAEQPMTFALVLLLAMNGSAGLARRELAATLWPQAADRDRNHRLRSLLPRLRRMGAPLICSGCMVAFGAARILLRLLVPRSSE